MEREINFEQEDPSFYELEGFELEPIKSLTSTIPDDLKAMTAEKVKPKEVLIYKRSCRLLGSNNKGRYDSSSDEEEIKQIAKKKENNKNSSLLNTAELEEYQNLMSQEIHKNDNETLKRDDKKELNIVRNGNSFSTTITNRTIQSLSTSESINTCRNSLVLNKIEEINIIPRTNTTREEIISEPIPSISHFNDFSNTGVNNSNNIRENRYISINKPKKHGSISMTNDLCWSKKVGNFEILRSQQILYKLIQKHNESSNVSSHKKFGR